MEKLDKEKRMVKKPVSKKMAITEHHCKEKKNKARPDNAISNIGELESEFINLHQYLTDEGEGCFASKNLVHHLKDREKKQKIPKNRVKIPKIPQNPKNPLKVLKIPLNHRESLKKS